MAVITSKFDDKCGEFWDVLTWSTGSLNFIQFYKAVQQNGVDLSYSALKKQWDIIDSDGSNDMDLDEFKVLMRKHFELSDDKQILQKAFNGIYKKMFEKDTSDLLSYKTETPRIANKNVAVVINKNTMKRNKAFQKALDKKLSDIFKALDVDKSGTLEFEEMWQAVQLLEIPINHQDLKLTFNFFDTDKNGHIEEDEFKRWMNSQITKYWADNPENNQFVALQRALSGNVKSTAFSFDSDTNDEKKDNDKKMENKENGIFANCTLNDVESWDMNMIGDFVNYLFIDKQYDDCRDKYVAIFMTNMVDGVKFMKLERKQISHMGIITKKGKRHVSVIKNAQRHIIQKSAK